MHQGDNAVLCYNQKILSHELQVLVQHGKNDRSADTVAVRVELAGFQCCKDPLVEQQGVIAGAEIRDAIGFDA
jgi:hypothetical protein